jgi:hypothetical protein
MAKEHITELTPYLTENPEVIQYINENIWFRSELSGE